MNKKNLFITFEGIDGAGKSTQIAKLKKKLIADGLNCKVTREPGGLPFGDKIREILKLESLEPKTEALLLYANRIEHIKRVIAPNLEKGIVISDRFNDSTIAYQQYGRGLPSEYISALSKGIIEPDITIYIDISLQIREKRLQNRSKDVIESENLEFQERVLKGYKDLAEKNSRIKVVDGAQAPDKVFSDILGYIYDH